MNTTSIPIPTEQSDEDLAYSISECMIELNHHAIAAAKRGLRVEYIPTARIGDTTLFVARVLRTF